MIYYFDVKETYVKTVGIEADDLSSAQYRVEELYNCRDFDCGGLPHDIEFEYVQDEVEDLIRQSYITQEEIEVF